MYASSTTCTSELKAGGRLRLGQAECTCTLARLRDVIIEATVRRRQRANAIRRRVNAAARIVATRMRLERAKLVEIVGGVRRVLIVVVVGKLGQLRRFRVQC